jgi:hypothetical protein
MALIGRAFSTPTTSGRQRFAVPVSGNATVAPATIAVVTSVPTPTVLTGATGFNQPYGDVSALSAEGTGNWGTSAHRVAWWNGYKSRWDMVLPTKVTPAADASDWWIIADAATQSPVAKVLVDGRTGARPDVRWDEPNKKLYVHMASDPGTGGGLMYSYTYNDTTDVYTVSVNGVAVGLDEYGGASGSSLGITPNGYLWVASNEVTAGLRVTRSTDGGATWGSPVTVKSTSVEGKVAISHFVNAGTTYVCVASGENGGGGVARSFHFVYIDSTSSGWGTAGNWTDNSSSIPALGTGTGADDEICMTRDSSENIYITAESEDVNATSPHTGQWIVFKRTPGGTWTKYDLNYNDSATSNKRPTITYDATNDEIYVFAQPFNRERQFYKKAAVASISNLQTAPEVDVLRALAADDFRNAHAPLTVTSASGLFIVSDKNYLTVAYNLLTIAGGVAATATPGTVAVTTSVPAPTVLAAAKPTPAVVAVAAAVPAPTVSSSAIATPAVVAVTTSVPAPAARGAAAPTPAVAAVTTSVPAPTTSGTAVATPAVVAVTTSVPAPSVIVAGNATAIVSTVTATASVPAAVLRSDRVAVVGTVLGAVTVPAPVLASDRLTTPATAAVTTSVPAPSAQGAAKPTPAVAAVSSSVPGPTTSGTAVTTPATVGVTTSVPAPSIVLAGNATASPSTVGVSAAVPAPAVNAGAVATPAAVSVTTAVPGPALHSDRIATPTTATVAASVPAPSASATARSTPAVVGVTSSVPAPTVTAGGDISVGVGTVTVSLAVPAPTTSGTARATTLVVSASSSVPAPSLRSDQTATPATAAAVTAVPSSTIRGSAVVQPATVAVAATVPGPTILAGGSVSVGVLTIAVAATVPAPSSSGSSRATPNAVLVVAGVPGPTLRGSAQPSPSTVLVITLVQTPVVFGGQIGVPVRGPTRKRVLVGPAGLEALEHPNGADGGPPNDTDVLVGAPRAVLLGSGRNGTEEA